MDHTEAVTKKLTESYLLGELTPEQREVFEEHYFTCSDCAEDIKTGAALVANVKEILQEDSSLSTAANRVHGYSGWFSWMRPAYSFAAVAAILAILIYQNAVTIPRLKGEFAKNSAPQALASFSFIQQGSRGANSLVVSAGPKQALIFYVDIPTSPDFVSYTCIIQSESGSTKWSMPVTTEMAKKEGVPLFVPGSLLQPGKYVLVIRGNRAVNSPSGTGTDIAEYAFSFESKNEGTTKQ